MVLARQQKKKALALNYNLLHNIFKRTTFYDKIEKDKLNRELKSRLSKENKYELLSKLSPVRIKAIIRVIQQELVDWDQTIETTIGFEFDKKELLNELKETINIIKSQGNLWPQDPTPRKISDLLKSFESSSVVPVIQNISTIVDVPIDKDPYKIISLLTGIDLSTKDFIYKFAVEFNNLLKQVEDTVYTRKETYKDYNPAPVIDEIKNNMDEMKNRFINISGGTNDLST